MMDTCLWCGSFLLSWLVDVFLLQQDIVTTNLIVHQYCENVLEASKCPAKEVKTIND